VAEYDEVIPPGQTGKISATLSTKNYRGKMNKSIMVEFNDHLNSKVKLQFICDILGVKILPKSRVYFNVPQGVNTTKELTIATIGESPLTIYAKPSHPNFKYQLEKLTNKKRPLNDTAYWNQYKLSITIPENFPQGRFSGTIALITDSEYDPSIKIYVSGAVNPAVVVSPASIRMITDRKTGGIAPRFVKVTRKHGDGFKISKIITSLQHLKTTISETKEGKQYSIKLVWNNLNSKGSHRGNIVLHTNDKQKPVITIPVFVEVK